MGAVEDSRFNVANCVLDEDANIIFRYIHVLYVLICNYVLYAFDENVHIHTCALTCVVNE